MSHTPNATLVDRLLAEAGRKECVWAAAPSTSPPTQFVHPEPLRALLAEAAASLLAAPVRPADGMRLVPERMHLDSAAVASLVFHLGGDEESTDPDERWLDGILWVGEAVIGDEGEKVYGLHVSNASYPEEGCATLVQFAIYPSQSAGEP